MAKKPGRGRGRGRGQGRGMGTVSRTIGKDKDTLNPVDDRVVEP